MAWHWGSKIWWSTSFTVEIDPWQEKGVTLCYLPQQFGSFCKKIKSLEIMEKKFISCPILFSFLLLPGTTMEGYIGRIYSYSEWVGGSEEIILS